MIRWTKIVKFSKNTQNVIKMIKIVQMAVKIKTNIKNPIS